MTKLDVDQLVTQASEATGLDDTGGDDWREGLERLLDSWANEARLNEIGEVIVAGEAVEYLTSRLSVVDWRRRHPEIADADVAPPIVVVGQARTGTTILHDLLAQDPANRVPMTWEVDKPCPPPETATYETDPRIEEIDDRLAGTELLIPGFRNMHPMGARLPQECVRITGSVFRSVIFGTQYRVPSYCRWVFDEADMAPTYRWHRQFLQHLQSRHPSHGTTRWVLKSPGHLWALGALLAEYPDALLVQTHRDPVRIVASVSSLIALLRTLASDEPSIDEVAAEWADFIIDGCDRSVRARVDGTVSPQQAVDVQFRDFMADPFVTIRSIYERLGLELTDDAEARMRAFLAENPSEKHGGHQYTFADTGLDAGELRERTRAYQEHFGVPSEALT
jgi:hypothetical protein